MKNIEIRQIFYNEDTRKSVEAPFIPLDNTHGDQSWFEFWPILQFLYTTDLKEDTLYGFVSPRFTEKTGISPADAMAKVRENAAADVVLFSYAWDQLCYFLNPWEQAEISHPGLMAETQKFLDAERIPIVLQYLITNLNCAVFSNLIVANKRYWSFWKNLALRFYLYTNFRAPDLGSAQTEYKNKMYPLKVFIQERFPALILTQLHLETALIKCPNKGLVPIFEDTEANRKLLMRCSQIKDQIIAGKRQQDGIRDFLATRKHITFVGGPAFQWGYQPAQKTAV